MAADVESLDEILSGPSTSTPETPEAEQPSALQRDDHGRFAPKGEAPEITAEQPEVPEQEADGEHNAPVGVAIAERRKRQAESARADALERDLAELRGQMSVLVQQRDKPATPPEPVKPPDFWEDPSKYVEHALTPFQQQIAEMTFRASRAEALAEFGKDTVKAAQEAVKKAVESGQLDGATVSAQLAKSRDPVGDVVRWHQNSPAVQETSLRDKLRAELMAEYGIDPAVTPQPAPSTRNPVVKLPPSLTRLPGGGNSAVEADLSDAGLFAHATAR